MTSSISFFPESFWPLSKPEFVSVSVWRSGSHPCPTWGSFTCITSAEVQCCCASFDKHGRGSVGLTGNNVVIFHWEQNARTLHPIGTAVFVGRSKWSGNPCCSFLCHTCSWSLCLCHPGYGSTSAGTGTTPGAGCMCRGRAATCL